MADYGYIYYPYKCYRSKSCKVHMHLHGCGQAVDSPFFDTSSLTTGGWLEYAAANDIILLMPQAKFDLMQNTFECFDYSGYVQWEEKKGVFAQKKSAQMQILKGMLDRVLEPLDIDYDY